MFVPRTALLKAIASTLGVVVTLVLAACGGKVLPPPARLEITVHVYGPLVILDREVHPASIDLSFVSGVPKIGVEQVRFVEARGLRASHTPTCGIKPGIEAVTFLRPGTRPESGKLEAGTVVAIARIGIPVLGTFTLASWKWEAEKTAGPGTTQFGLIGTEHLDCAVGSAAPTQATGVARLVLPITILGKVQHGGRSRDVAALKLNEAIPGLRLDDDAVSVEAKTVATTEAAACSVRHPGPAQYLRPGTEPAQGQLAGGTRVTAVVGFEASLFGQLVLGTWVAEHDTLQEAVLRARDLENRKGRDCGNWELMSPTERSQ